MKKLTAFLDSQSKLLADRRAKGEDIGVPTGLPEKADPGLPKASVTAPAAMLALPRSSAVMPLIAKRAVVLPGSTVTPLTRALGKPASTRSVVWTELGSSGSLKLTSKVNGVGSVKVPPIGGFVEVTCKGTAS